jgi:hypothetical protein
MIQRMLTITEIILTKTEISNNKGPRIGNSSSLFPPINHKTWIKNGTNRGAEHDDRGNGGERGEKKIAITDLNFLQTLGESINILNLGTGTFGRVRLVKFSNDPKNEPMALKMLKKTEIIRLKQVEHVRSEKKILSLIKHPFIVAL